jgi:hypothetical protein
MTLVGVPMPPEGTGLKLKKLETLISCECLDGVRSLPLINPISCIITDLFADLHL